MTADTPDTPPATPEDALTFVQSRFGRPKLPDGSPAEMRVHEFEEGYLVHAVFPLPTDAAGRPTPPPPGGAHVVVLKETGETSTVPNYPPEQAVELFRENRARRRNR